MKDRHDGVFIDLERQHVIPIGTYQGETFQDIVWVKHGGWHDGYTWCFRPTQISPDLYAACVPLTDAELGSLCVELDDRLQASTAAFEMVRAMDHINNVRKRADR